MISVIVPTYNHARALTACLKSIWRQTYADVEVIIVNDGSTDETRAVVQRFIASHPTHRVVTYLEQPHRGAPAARNIGARNAQGQYLVFADADLILNPRMLEVLQKALTAHPEASYAYSSFRLVWKKFPSQPFDADALRRAPYIHTSALIRSDHFPGFDETLDRFQDWDLWLTMLEAGHVGVFVPEVLFRARVTRAGISKWRPRAWYAAWSYLRPAVGFAPSTFRNYEFARRVIRVKHKLP